MDQNHFQEGRCLLGFKMNYKKSDFFLKFTLNDMDCFFEQQLNKNENWNSSCFAHFSNTNANLTKKFGFKFDMDEKRSTKVCKILNLI